MEFTFLSRCNIFYFSNVKFFNRMLLFCELFFKMLSFFESKFTFFRFMSLFQFILGQNTVKCGYFPSNQANMAVYKLLQAVIVAYGPWYSLVQAVIYWIKRDIGCFKWDITKSRDLLLDIDSKRGPSRTYGPAAGFFIIGAQELNLDQKSIRRMRLSFLN